MRTGNTQSGLTFRQAIVVDFTKSQHGCACERDFDATMAAVNAGKVERGGATPYPIPGTYEKKYIIANGEHKDILEPLARQARRSANPADVNNFKKAIEKMISGGVEVIHYHKLLEIKPGQTTEAAKPSKLWTYVKTGFSRLIHR